MIVRPLAPRHRRTLALVLVLPGLLGPTGGCVPETRRPVARAPAAMPVDSPRASPTRDAVAEPPRPAWIEIQPGVRVNLPEKLVEFDGAVAVDCHQPETPDVYLEVLCCTPDTREHEALVVTRAQPSTIHAALLAVGAKPGAPGAWRARDGRLLPVLPRGSAVQITFLHDTPGIGPREIDPATWIVRKGTDRTLREAEPGTGWVFAGSRIRRFRGRDVYDADGTGQLIGLHTFGSETLAWTRVESPEATRQEPIWLTNNALVPPIGTPITVRLAVLDADPAPDTPPLND